jgi:hypothetical protein
VRKKGRSTRFKFLRRKRKEELGKCAVGVEAKVKGEGGPCVYIYWKKKNVRGGWVRELNGVADIDVYDTKVHFQSGLTSPRKQSGRSIMQKGKE